jgi:hypothetical protein
MLCLQKISIKALFYDARPPRPATTVGSCQKERNYLIGGKCIRGVRRHTGFTARNRANSEKEREMELFRNMEVALMLCFGLVCAAACIVRPPLRTAEGSSAQAPPAGPMPVVVITGKRLSADEKRSLAREQA